MSSFEYRQPAKLGWVGLGAMGFPMADNLLRRIPTLDTLYIYDVDQRAIDHFMVKSARESAREDRVVVAKSAREVSEKSVRSTYCVQILFMFEIGFYYHNCSGRFVGQSQQTINVLMEYICIGSHVRSVYLIPETGLLAAPNLSEKIFVDWCGTSQSIK